MVADGTYVATVDRIEGEIAVVLVEEDGDVIGEVTPSPVSFRSESSRGRSWRSASKMENSLRWQKILSRLMSEEKVHGTDSTSYPVDRVKTSNEG